MRVSSMTLMQPSPVGLADELEKAQAAEKEASTRNVDKTGSSTSTAARSSTARDESGQPSDSDPVKKERRTRASNKRKASTADHAGYETIPGRICEKCADRNNDCLWAPDGYGACAECARRRVGCSDNRGSRPKSGPRPRRSSPPIVDKLREATASTVGTTPVSPSTYGGQQRVQARQEFPGLVADMHGEFVSNEDYLWGNIMNVTANTHLQIDGTLRALLAESMQTRQVLIQIADALLAVAGAAARGTVRAERTNVPPSPSPELHEDVVPEGTGTENIEGETREDQARQSGVSSPATEQTQAAGTTPVAPAAPGTGEQG